MTSTEVKSSRANQWSENLPISR